LKKIKIIVIIYLDAESSLNIFLDNYEFEK